MTTTRTARTEKLEELHQRLTAQVEALVTGEEWKAMLDVASKLHPYSARNVILILSQRPEGVTRVCGYRRWQSLGRQVRKGEQGIAILAPCMYRVRPADEAPAMTRPRSPASFGPSGWPMSGMSPRPTASRSPTSGPSCWSATTRPSCGADWSTSSPLLATRSAGAPAAGQRGDGFPGPHRDCARRCRRAPSGEDGVPRASPCAAPRPVPRAGRPGPGRGRSRERRIHRVPAGGDGHHRLQPPVCRQVVWRGSRCRKRRR